MAFDRKSENHDPKHGQLTRYVSTILKINKTGESITASKTNHDTSLTPQYYFVNIQFEKVIPDLLISNIEKYKKIVDDDPYSLSISATRIDKRFKLSEELELEHGWDNANKRISTYLDLIKIYYTDAMKDDKKLSDNFNDLRQFFGLHELKKVNHIKLLDELEKAKILYKNNPELLYDITALSTAINTLSQNKILSQDTLDLLMLNPTGAIISAGIIKYMHDSNKYDRKKCRDVLLGLYRKPYNYYRFLIISSLIGEQMRSSNLTDANLVKNESPPTEIKDKDLRFLETCCFFRASLKSTYRIGPLDHDSTIKKPCQ